MKRFERGLIAKFSEDATFSKIDYDEFEIQECIQPHLAELCSESWTMQVVVCNTHVNISCESEDGSFWYSQLALKDSFRLEVEETSREDVFIVTSYLTDGSMLRLMAFNTGKRTARVVLRWISAVLQLYAQQPQLAIESSPVID